GGGVSGAEHGPGPGGAGGVGSPGGFVADDGDALARPVTPLDLVRGNAARMVVEELVDGVSGRARRPGGEFVVGVELIPGVFRQGAEQQVADELDEGGVAALAGRQDVVTLLAAVVRGRLGQGRVACT